MNNNTSKLNAFYHCAAVLVMVMCTMISNAAVQTDGPMVGAVTHIRAKVFLRTDEPAQVQIEYSEFSDMSNSAKTLKEVTRYGNDLTKIVTLKGLVPSTKYYYRVIVDSIAQQTGNYPSFTTFARQSRDAEFSFGLLSDVGNYAKNSAGVYRTLASFEPSFVLQIGDLDHRDPVTLREMRQMHRDVRGFSAEAGSYAGADFSRYLAPVAPIFHMWDDHDYGMNDGDYTFSEKSNAIKAFLEYYPVPDLPNPDAGIWHMFRYAQAEFFVLDTRSNRDPNDTVDDVNKSMLDGENIVNDQKTWLFDNLLASTAKWKFITTGSPFNPSCKPSDGWGAFVTEHDEIVDFVNDNNITGVIIISGDIHSGGALDDGTNSGVVEFSVPHTNMQMAPDHSGFTTQRPGTWSEFVNPGVSEVTGSNAGFGWMSVLTNPDRVEIQVIQESGLVKNTYTVLLDTM